MDEIVKTIATSFLRDCKIMLNIEKKIKAYVKGQFR